jgi:hypothetical protein
MFRLVPALVLFFGCSTAAHFPSLNIRGSSVRVVAIQENDGWRYEYIVRADASAKVGVLQLILPVRGDVPFKLVKTDERLDLITTESSKILNFADVISPGNMSEPVVFRSSLAPCDATGRLSPDSEPWYDVMLEDPKIRARIQADDTFRIELPRDPHEYDLSVPVKVPCV